MLLSFIHAADFHLGAGLNRFGPAAETLEKAQFQALEKTLQWAVEDDAAFVLISGDLFDNRNPSPGILRKAGEIFSAGADTQVYILPGTHDFLSDKSVLASDRADWIPANVTILNENIASPFYDSDLDCHLYFRPNRSNRSAKSPIAGFVRRSEGGFHIGLAHGSLKIGGLNVSNDFPIDAEDIKNSCLNYLALGHWHRPRVEKCSQTTVAYPGIGQPIAFSDPEKGSVLYVRLEDTGDPVVQQRPVSSITLKQLDTKIYHPKELIGLFDRLADHNTILKLRLQYSDNFKEANEVETLISKASSRFLLVQSDDNKLKGPASSADARDSSNRQLIKAFKAELARLKEADSEERSKLYDKAAELGSKIIIGEK
jgi:DNA repair exonuclease SbcCD nuclease subunit